MAHARPDGASVDDGMSRRAVIRGVGLGGVAAVLLAAGWTVETVAQQATPPSSVAAEANAVVVIFGTPTDVAAFEEYYLNTHRPTALQMPHLIEIAGGPVVGTLDGSQTEFHRIAVLRYENQDDLMASVSSPEGQAAFADVANFATGTVTVFLTSWEASPAMGPTGTPAG